MASHLEFFGYDQLRYGYFWPYPNMIKAEVPHQPTLEDVDREMEGRDTIKDIPVFAMRVQDRESDSHIPFSTNLDGSPDSVPIIADRIIMLDSNPMGDDHILLAEIDSGWGE